jgi:hypothetical protein
MLASYFQRLVGVFLLALLGITLPRAAGAIEPEPLPKSDAAPTWTGQQFVQADRAGNVYFLRTDTFAIYRLTKQKTFDEPVRLETVVDRPGSVYSAAMSLSGDRWLVQDAKSARLFSEGKEQPVPPLPYKPWSVAFLRDSPLVAVVPLFIRGGSIDIQKLGDAPWFLRLGRDQWDPVVTLKGVSSPELLKKNLLNQAIAENAAFMAGDRQGKLWVARQYAYHVQKMTASGRALLDITVDGGKVRKPQDTKGIEISLKGPTDNPTEATQNPRQERGTYTAFTAPSTIEAITEGQDGRIYLFVHTEDGGSALDRYDSGRNVLSRIPLSLKLKDQRPSLAAGRDGLYLAAWSGDGGRWRISWERLEQAHWKKVEGSKIDGIPEE